MKIPKCANCNLPCANTNKTWSCEDCKYKVSFGIDEYEPWEEIFHNGFYLVCSFITHENKFQSELYKYSLENTYFPEFPILILDEKVPVTHASIERLTKLISFS